MGISDFLQNVNKVNTVPVSFQTRGSNANRISDSDTPGSSNRELKNELQSEQIRKQKLLELEEERVQAMAALEHKQRQTKAFVDRHRRQAERQFAIGKPVLVFQTKMGLMTGKLRF